MAKAVLILNLRDDRPNGIIIAQRIHRLAEPNAVAPHGYVYPLHCGTRAGQTLVRFDNETGLTTHQFVSNNDFRAFRQSSRNGESSI